MLFLVKHKNKHLHKKIIINIMLIYEQVIVQIDQTSLTKK